MLLLLLAPIACQSPGSLRVDPSGIEEGRDDPLPADPGAPPDTESYLLRNERFIEGLYARSVDLEDVDAMFWHVFSRLPGEVTVYPSENYYYFILHVQGRQVWGNIRLPAGQREKGMLSFGYFEFKEFPQLRGPKTGMTRSKFYGPEHGVAVQARDPLTWEVTFRGRTVVFHLHPLDQQPPRLFPLREDEVFVERTFDESGYQFFLLFNTAGNYFFWVLNEEPGVPDVLVPDRQTPDLLLGERSGFAFWVDREHGDRKVLLAIRKLNSNRNDYYDGPFDQLADNYAEETRIAEYMQRAAPGLRGRIDKFGYYTDQERPMRVALACYYSYLARSDLLRFLERAREAEDFYRYVSRRGIPTAEELRGSPAGGEGAGDGDR